GTDGIWFANPVQSECSSSASRTQSLEFTKRVAVLFNPPTPAAPFGKLYFQSIAAAAPRFGIEPFSMEIDDEADVERKLSDVAREPNSGLIVLLDAFTYVHRDFIIGQAARYRIPAVYTVLFFFPFPCNARADHAIE